MRAEPLDDDTEFGDPSGAELALIDECDGPDGWAASTNRDTVAGRLHTERRLMWLPPAVAAASGGVDLWMHQDMVAHLHTHPVVSLISWAVGAGATGAAILAGMWALASRDATDGLPRKTPRTTTEDTADDLPVGLKKITLTGMTASGVLTALGAQPMTLGGCLLVAALGTASWYKTRHQYRRALRQALAALPEDGEQLALPAPGPVEDTPGSITDQMLTVMRRWELGIAGSILVGTELLHPEVTNNGCMSFVVDGGDHGVLLDAANAAREKIGSVLRLELPDADGHGGQEVMFDQPGGYGLDQGQLRMQIVNLATTAAIPTRVVSSTDLVHAPGAPYSPRISGYLDDGSNGYWTLADNDGACSGVVIGGMGLGKSSLLDLIAYRAMLMGFQVLYIDPADGSSSQILVEHATWTALGIGAGYTAYQFVTELATTRQKWMTMHGIGKIVPGMTAPCLPNGLRPNPDCICGGVVPPPILIINDECDITYNDVVPGTTATKMGKLWGPLAKRLRKLAMAIIAASQLTDIDVFGGDDMLRSTLALRNLLAMFVRSSSGGVLIPGLPYNPCHLPDKVGRALMCGRDARGIQAMLDHVPRREDAGNLGGTVFAEDLFEQLPRVAPYQPDTLCADFYLLTPGVDTDQASTARAAAAADFDLIMRGVRPESGTTPSVAPASTNQAVPLPDLEWPDVPAGPLPALSDGELEDFYAAQAAAADESPAQQDNANAAIWRLLVAGVTEKGDLITASGYGETQVRNALNRLMAGLPDGRQVERVKRGSYRPVAASVEV